MDTNNTTKLQITGPKAQKGFVLVWFVILIPLIILMMLIAIDFSYIYMAKGQLQNAADSAALAGAGVMAGGGTQSSAVIETKKFGLANQAAKQNVIIEDSNITFGFWSKTTGYQAGGTPVNAIQVTAARTTSSAGGPVPILFGKYFGFEYMSPIATATAAFAPRATIGLNMCLDFCRTGSTYPSFAVYTTLAKPPLVMITGPTAPYDQSFAWTSYTTKTTAPGNDLLDQICAQTSVSQSSCGQTIYSTMGGPTTALRHLEAQMYNPNFDRANKDFDASGNVNGWWVIIPITGCPPGAQGNAWDPKPVVRYSKAHVIAICTKGGGNVGSTCSNYAAPAGACDAIHAKYGLPAFNNNIIINKITCVDCPASQLVPGLRPFLVDQLPS